MKYIYIYNGKIGNEVWCRGFGPKDDRLTIVRCRPNGSYDVLCKENGNKYFKVAGSLLVPYEQAGGTTRTRLVDWNKQHLNVGKRIEIRSSPSDGIAEGKGVIISVGDDKSRCDIRYDNGTLEMGIPTEFVSAEKDKENGKWIGDEDEPRYTPQTKVIIGVLPKAGSLDTTRFLQYGEIVNLVDGGVASSLGGSVYLYNVRLEDGRTMCLPEKEISIKSNTYQSKSSSGGNSFVLTSGTYVSVKYPDDTLYFGKVKTLSSDGSLIIRYDDGSIEVDVPRKSVQAIKHDHHDHPSKKNHKHVTKHHHVSLTKGDRVLVALSKGDRVLCYGTVSAVSEDGTLYDVDVKEKGRQKKVPRSKLRSLEKRKEVSEQETNEREQEAELWAKHATVIRGLKRGTAVQLRLVQSNKSSSMARHNKDSFTWHDAHFVRCRSDGTVEVTPATSHEEVVVRAQPHHVRYSPTFKSKDRHYDTHSRDEKDYKKTHQDEMKSQKRANQQINAWSDTSSCASSCAPSCHSSLSSASHCSTFTSSSSSSSRQSSLSSRASTTSSTTYDSASLHSGSTASRHPKTPHAKHKIKGPTTDRRSQDEEVEAALRRLRVELKRLAGSDNKQHKQQHLGGTSFSTNHPLSTTWQLFSSLDENASGKIGIQELKKCLEHLKIKLSKRECQAIVEKVGNNGMFDLDSFIHFIEVDDDLTYRKHRPTTQLHHHLHHDEFSNHNNENYNDDGEKGFENHKFSNLRSSADYPHTHRRKSKGVSERGMKKVPVVQFEDVSRNSHSSHGDRRKNLRQPHRPSEKRLRPPIIAICDPNLTS